MSKLDDFFSNLSTLTGGASIDHLKVVFTLLASYPVALIYKSLPQRNPNLKHMFSITMAIIVLFGLFDLANAFYVVLSSSLISYTIIYHVKGVWGPRLVLLYALGHLSFNHIYRQLNRIPYEKFDSTGPQMVLVIKLTSFAFNVFDGRRSTKELTSYQRNKAIYSMPSILEYLGYVFFFGGFMVGPAFEFMDYRRFTNMEMFRIGDEKDSIKENNDYTEKKIKNNNKFINHKNNTIKGVKESNNDKYDVPNGLIPAIGKLTFGIFFVLCLVTFEKKYPMDWTLSEEFKSISFFDKLFYIQIASLCARFKYYVVWLFAEGACILSGLGFNGYDENGKAKWNRVTNVDIIAYETADNIKTLLESWNMNTNKWLKNYVYLRVTPPGKKPNFFSTFATFGTSAIWHGFYPGYYLTFVSGAFVQSLHRTLRHRIRPIFLTPKFSSLKPLYNILGWLLTQTMIHYIIIPFNLLSLKNSLQVWRSLCFFGHVSIISINLIFWFGFNQLCRKLVQIGDGVGGGKGKGNVDYSIRVKKWKVDRKDDEVVIDETGIGIPLEVDKMDLKKEE